MSFDDYEDMKERDLLEALRPVKRLVAPVDPETRARHLAAIGEAARELRSVQPERVPRTPTPDPRWRTVVSRSWSFTLKLSAAAMAASLSLMGLAYANVDLPGSAAEKAVEAVMGVDLPNQETDAPSTSEHGKSVSDDVRSVVEGTEERGCEFGQAVSDAASANAQGEGQDKEACKTDEDAGTEAGVTADEGTSDEEKPDSRGNSEAGAENAGTHNDDGQAQADESSSTGQEHQSDNAPLGGENAGTNNDKGQTTAEEKSSTGKETGETHSEQGKSHKPDDPGKP